MWFSGSANLNMLSEFSREQRGCHGNQNWAKISQNCTDFSSVQDIETLFACRMWFSGVGEFKYATPNFQESKGGCHGNQVWAKINQNCTDFSSVQDIETLFACRMWFSGLANSNMLSEFSREQRGCYGN